MTFTQSIRQPKVRRPRVRQSRRRRRYPTGSVATGLALAAIVVVWIVLPHDPNGVDLNARLLRPSTTHLLGTDHLGRDVATRLAHGSIPTLGIASGSLMAGAVIGTVLGMAVAWRGGRSARITATSMDTLIALPELIVALVVVSSIGPGAPGLIIAVTAVGWLPFARSALDVTQRLRAQGYVEAAVSMGAGPGRILLRTVLPNAARPLLAHLFLRFPAKLVLVTGLAFLGLGPQPPAPEWGTMLFVAMPFIDRHPVASLAPALAIVALGISVASIGRSIEDRRSIHDRSR